MKARLIIITATALAISATVALGAVKEGQFSISPVIGGYTFDSDQHLKTNLVYGARAGYNFTKKFGVEALFDYAKTDSDNGGKGDVSMYRYGGELLYHLWPDNNLVPYLAAGYAGIRLKYDGYAINKGAFDYGLGAKYFLNDSFALRGDVRHIVYSYNKTNSNFEYTLGAHIPFGGVKPAAQPVVQESSQPKAAPAAPQVVSEPAPKPLSTLSAVPATITSGQPARLSWTSQNAADCAIQPDVGPVALQGSKDITPTADTSYTLTCKGEGGSTTSAAAVAVTMPPPPKPVAQPVVQSAQKASAAQRFCNKPAVLAVEFDTNKADIKPKYKPDLEKLSEFLTEFPNAKGEISGHTDNVGGKEFNTKLSQRRADSVKQYMQKNFGIAPDRLTAKGFGFSKPVANNKTKQGKAKNRRIETNFTCE
ncbi:MAG: OmpA family protein [Deltaproteobacteria bacterium]